MPISKADIEKAKRIREESLKKYGTPTNYPTSKPKTTKPSSGDLSSAFKGLTEERNEIQRKLSKDANLPYVAQSTGTALAGKEYDSKGNLTDYGKFVTTQLNPEQTNDPKYNEYLQNARNKGSSFLGYEDYKKQINKPEDDNRVIGDSGYTPGGSTINNFVNTLAEAQKLSKAEQLKKIANQQKGVLNQERSLVSPAFSQARTAAKTQSELGARSFSDFLASKGIGGGQQAQGAEQQSEIAQNVALQGETGALRQQEARTLADIARREADVDAGLISDIASAEAGIDANELARQQELADLQERRDYAERLDAEERERKGEEQAFNEQLQTIGQYAGNYQAEIDRRSAINPNDPLLPYLQQARQEKIQSQNLDPVTGRPLQTGVDLSPSQAMQLWGITGQANEDVARALGVNVGDNYSTYAQRLRGSGGASVASDATGTGIDTTDDYKVFENVFIETLQNNPSTAKQLLEENKREIINAKGAKRYYDLMDDADDAVQILAGQRFR